MHAGRHRASDAAPVPSMPRLALLAVAVAVVALVAWLATTQVHRSSGGNSASASTQRSLNDAADTWVRDNVPIRSRLLTDGLAAPAGYHTGTLVTDGQDWRQFDYLITAQTKTPLADAPITTVWQSSTPAAVFDGAQVRRILLVPPEQIQRDRDADRTDRAKAGAALLRNPNVVASPDARVVLENGQLDLRAATVLTGIASQTHINLADVTVAGPEAAAGVPARSITVYATDPSRVSRLLGGFTAVFQPDQVSVGENGAIRLHWPLSFTPIPSVS